MFYEAAKVVIGKLTKRLNGQKIMTDPDCPQKRPYATEVESGKDKEAAKLRL